MESIDPPKRQFSVTIIGAGVGGLTLTLGLLRHNISVTIYEAAPSFKRTGFGLSMSPAAHRALSLIDPSIRKAYDALVTTHADSPGYEHFCQTWFELVWTTADMRGKVLTNLRAKSLGQTSVYCGDFLDALIDCMPRGKVQWGKNLIHMEEMAQGTKLHFEDGSSTMADVVIGCDGIHSRVRQCMLPGEQIQPRYAGMYAYRAVLDMATMVEAVGERRARVATMYMGKGGYVVTYPIMHAKQVNVGFFRESDSWNHHTWAHPTSKEEMEQDFGHMGDAVRSIMKHIINPVQWAVFDNPPISTYARDNMAILGDAAHASTPHQGAGAGQAIEDVHILTELMGDQHVLQREHVKSAFHAYDTVRRPRSQWVVRTSRDMGQLLSLSLDTVTGEEDLKKLLSRRMALLWDLDVTGQAEIARQFMLYHLRLTV
ncbi:putative salicylate hydroxylase [Aspergillus steynii IBT 23096]|uniref:Putative salicylate hydroxylase n=1 Tax=Aspergillus steynii IBT 23096 TaxID=1392250 RepID=A0A2I2GKD1_9EURO|nr:putative salicylate hydroxylase [Aspergillus steynii IBT 23096]PLB53343.1 putative salicylate hydroxylase [Aspergillus steynii IBT 23096]